MKLIVSLHDVHPGSLRAIEAQRADLRTWGVRRLSLLVVPFWHGRERIDEFSGFIEALRRWRDEGDEIVLHGWRHDCEGLTEHARDWFWTRVYTNREAEFLVATETEARQRLSDGMELLGSLDLYPAGFVAPAWLMAGHVPRLLSELGFAYLVARRSIVPLSTRAVPTPAATLCYSCRNAWRRVASRAWNPLVSRRARRNSVLRVSIHPLDIAFPPVWKQIAALTRAALTSSRVPSSYGQSVAGAFTGR